jgi:ASC-1-like (ASCH) protein
MAVDINVADPWFSHIRSGAKTVEGRLNKGKFAELKVGSTLVIAKSGGNARTKRLVAVVTRVVRYPSFETYLSQEGLARTLPGVASISDGVDVYRQFYTVDQEKEHGIAAIHLVHLS